MRSEDTIQGTITRNVKVLLATTGRDQRQLATELGWDPPRISKTFNGNRKWALSDLSALGKVFGLDPIDLLNEDVGHVARAGQQLTNRALTGQYDPATASPDLQIALIKDPWGDYQPVGFPAQDVIIPAQRRAGVTRPDPTLTGENADAA